MKITKSYLRQIIKEEILKEFSASDIDMEDLALVYDEEYGPDYVAGIMASEFPALDTDAAYEKVLGMLREAARRGEEDYPLNFLANRIAELVNKMDGVKEAYESGAARAEREMYLKRMGRESEYLDRANTEKLQTMLYKLEDDFLPFLMNTEEVEIGEAANQLYKLLKARVEG